MSKQKEEDVSGRVEGAMTRGRKKKQLTDDVVQPQQPPVVEAQQPPQPPHRAPSPPLASSSTLGMMTPAAVLLDQRARGRYLGTHEGSASQAVTCMRHGVQMPGHSAGRWFNRRTGRIEEPRAPYCCNARRAARQRAEEAGDTSGAPGPSDSDSDG